MRVLHIINTLEMGGAQTVLLQLLRAWPKEDTHCVISLRAGADLDSALAQAGARVKHVGANPFRLLKAARAFKPDLIQSWLYHSDLAATGIALALGVPLVWGVHHTTMAQGSVKGSTMAVVRLLARLSHRPGPVPARVICCSRSAYDSHIALGYNADKCVLIENGVDTAIPAFSPTDRAEIRAELGIPLGAVVVGMFARFNPQKDHRGFLRAAALMAQALARQEWQAAFLLAGPGVDPSNAELMAWVAEEGLQARAHLLGTRADIPRLIHAVDVLTLSSAYGEALPMILCEGMAQGALCVATDVGDSAKLIGDAGWIVPPSDPQALCEAWLKAAACDEAEGQRRSQLARDRVQKYYGIGAMLENYRQTYRDVIGKAADEA